MMRRLLLELGFDRSPWRHTFLNSWLILTTLNSICFPTYSSKSRMGFTSTCELGRMPRAKHVDNQATLGAALHRALMTVVLGLVHLVPSVIDARSLVADHELAIGVFLLFNEYWNLVPSLELGVVSIQMRQ